MLVAGFVKKSKRGDVHLSQYKEHITEFQTVLV
jgi:hypothetical protein